MKNNNSSEPSIVFRDKLDDTNYTCPGYVLSDSGLSFDRDVPFPIIYFEQTSPAQTIAVGLDASLVYNIKVYKSISVNLLGSFQFDTNGDNIIGYGLGLVKSF